MSAEHVGEAPESQSSEEHREWQGQRWEHLVVETHPTMAEGYILGRIKSKGIFSSSEQLDPVADYYNQRIKSLAKEQEEGAALTDVLNLVGNDGWELVTGVNAFSLDGTGKAFLIFKRLIITSEE